MVVSLDAMHVVTNRCVFVGVHFVSSVFSQSLLQLVVSVALVKSARTLHEMLERSLDLFNMGQLHVPLVALNVLGSQLLLDRQHALLPATSATAQPVMGFAPAPSVHSRTALESVCV